MYYAFKNGDCTKVKPQNYICKKLNIPEVKDNNACEIQLLNMENTYVNLSTNRSYSIETDVQTIKKINTMDWYISR